MARAIQATLARPGAPDVRLTGVVLQPATRASKTIISEGLNALITFFVKYISYSPHPHYLRLFWTSPSWTCETTRNQVATLPLPRKRESSQARINSTLKFDRIQCKSFPSCTERVWLVWFGAVCFPDHVKMDRDRATSLAGLRQRENPTP